MALFLGFGLRLVFGVFVGLDACGRIDKRNGCVYSSKQKRRFHKAIDPLNEKGGSGRARFKQTTATHTHSHTHTHTHTHTLTH